MVKKAIISDIHGDYKLLQLVLEDIDRKGIKEIYCLGDIFGEEKYKTNFDKENNKCLEALVNSEACIIKGNIEDEVNPEDNFFNLTHDNIGYVRSLPLINREGHNGEVLYIHTLPRDERYNFVNTLEAKKKRNELANAKMSDEELIKDYQASLLKAFKCEKFKVAFVGHSHSIGIFEYYIENGQPQIKEHEFDMNNKFVIPTSNSRYIVNIGNITLGGKILNDQPSYIIYDNENNEVELVQLTL